MSANNMPRIDLIMVGNAPSEISAVHGDFDSWFIHTIASLASVTVQHCYSGQPLPPLDKSDGWIITGSPASVYDAIEWLDRAKARIRSACIAEHPVLGVCFGHQLLAEALGGKVALNPQGWELGLAEVELTPEGRVSDLFADLDNPGIVFETHHDSVQQLPPQAVRLAENKMGIQAFQIGANSLGVQFHPEFTPEIARAYVRQRSNAPDLEPVEHFNKGERSNLILSNFIQYYVS
ncbi:type 1 glutamine amidotransferase [Candidatus Neomarinimicrobiota bacterium]